MVERSPVVESAAEGGMTPEWLAASRDRAIRRLLEMRTPEGFWEGHLSSSALSTATAVSALAVAGRPGDGALVERGLRWLLGTRNSDGGWGDTPDSPSNLSTSLLVSAAFRLARAEGIASEEAEACLEAYLCRVAGSTPEERRTAVCSAYDPDRTFAVPILMNLALAGTIPWEGIPPLPFELAAFPQAMFRHLRFPVVSYALPALIAVGLAVDRRCPAVSPWRRWLRGIARGRAVRRLEEIQPSSGGFLEAVPLTSFVVMGLAPLYGSSHPVVERGLAFLRRAVREDGSWPIDVNLSVWLTSAAVTALAEAGRSGEAASAGSWLKAMQHRRRHPYTGAPPGGWAWTHLPGGVPDADDTAGALLALRALGEEGPSIESGVRWLLELQNRDGGWPTFCRGWGRLPFDRSAPDLTAHVLRALGACAAGRRPRIRAALERGYVYLRATQRPDGSWIPLWFGHQAAPGQNNPVFGTARVLRALERMDPGGEPARAGLRFLLEAQNHDGGWGGSGGVPSSVEETALAVSALSGWIHQPEVHGAVRRGVLHLVERVESGVGPAPIGLYFARLWYGEEAYPRIWTVEALGRVLTRKEGVENIGKGRYDG